MHVCAFCKAEYKHEKVFLKHICRQKKRFFEKDTKAARLAFHTFQHFTKVHMRRDTTYEKFMVNTAYDAFLAFGKYMLDIDAISPLDFADYMVRSQVPIDRWCRDSEYEKFVQQLTVRENPERAFERTMDLMQEWSVKYSRPWTEFFREVSGPLAVQWITSGRISPWVMLNCQSGQAMMAGFTDEQILLVTSALNARFWAGKFQRHPIEVGAIQKTLKEEGL